MNKLSIKISVASKVSKNQSIRKKYAYVTPYLSLYGIFRRENISKKLITNTVQSIYE